MENDNVKILERMTQTTNIETGEATLKQEQVSLRTQKRERFMLLFVENFHLLVGLRKRTQEVLAKILTYKITYGTNEAILDTAFRNRLAAEIGVSKFVIANTIAELVDKKVLLRIKSKYGGYEFFLNPHLFGQGSWNMIQRQRQQLTIDYNFEDFTAQREIKIVSAYEGLLDKDDIQVVKREHYVDGNGMEVFNALVESKDSSKNEVKSIPNIIASQNKEEVKSPKELTLDFEQNTNNLNDNIMQFAGIIQGAFHPTKTAKEMKQEMLDEEYGK